MLDNDGATTCSMVSDENVDQNMDSLDEIDCRILAPVIMSVDVTEVFSLARVHKLAAKFGLVLRHRERLGFQLCRRSTQGLGIDLEDSTVRNKRIPPPHVRCLVVWRSLTSTYIVTILSGLRRSTRRSETPHNMLSSALRFIGIS